jgi:hypothetical protein
LLICWYNSCALQCWPIASARAIANNELACKQTGCGCVNLLQTEAAFGDLNQKSFEPVIVNHKSI